VVSRGLCRYHPIPRPEGAAGARWREALALEIARLSPFADTAWHLDAGTDHAGAWMWDRQAVAAAAAALGLDAERLRVVPETAMRPPQQDGLRVVAGLDGVEGQYWSEGRLMASRWWPDTPDTQSWTLFQRGAAVPPERFAPAPPPLQQLAWLPRPWTRSGPAGAWGLRQIGVARLTLLAAAAVLAVCAGLGGAALRLDHDIAGLRERIAARTAEASGSLDARNAAFANLAEIRRFRDFDRFPGQLEVMAELVRRLPPSETRFAEWSYDHGQLDLVVAADHPLDTVSLVRALAASPAFKDVAVERYGDQSALRIRLNVVPKWQD
jgi:hypothetical protein